MLEKQKYLNKKKKNESLNIEKSTKYLLKMETKFSKNLFKKTKKFILKFLVYKKVIWIFNKKCTILL